MATFSNWVKDQLEREDSVGFFARYWDSVTPGRISSITGVGRHLEKIERDYGEQPPDGQDRNAWLSGKSKVDAAMAGYHLAVKEYHGAEALDNARREGVLPDPPVEPYSSRATLMAAREGALARDAERRSNSGGRITGHGKDAGQLAGVLKGAEPDGPPAPARRAGTLISHGGGGAGEAAPAAQPAGKYTGWPEERFNRLEARLARVEGMLERVLKALEREHIDPDPLPWAELWALADKDAQP